MLPIDTYQQADLTDPVWDKARVLNLARRRILAVLRSGTARRSGPYRDCVQHQYNVRLDKPALKELNRRLVDLRDYLMEQDRQADGEFYTLTYVLSPDRKVEYVETRRQPLHARRIRRRIPRPSPNPKPNAGFLAFR